MNCSDCPHEVEPMGARNDAPASVLCLNHQAGVGLIVRLDFNTLLISICEFDESIPSQRHSFLLIWLTGSFRVVARHAGSVMGFDG
jgi:hypothetical protein